MINVVVAVCVIVVLVVVAVVVCYFKEQMHSHKFKIN